MSELPPVSFATNNWKLAKFILLGCLIFVLGIWLVNHPNGSRHYSPAFLVFDGYVLAAGSAFVVGLLALRLLRQKTELQLDNQGFRVDQGSAASQFVAWKAISGMIMVSNRGVKTIRVTLAGPDPDSLRTAAPVRKRSFTEGWRRVKPRRHLSIRTNFFECQPDDILETMTDYWRTATANSGDDTQA